MATTHTRQPWLETSWFGGAPPGEFDDLDAAPVMDDRRARRRRTVKVLGGLCIAGLFALAATGMATSTAARDAIASWGTMGKVAQARLTTSPMEDAELAERANTLETAPIAWAMGPAPAELSQGPVTEITDPEPALATPPVAAAVVQPRAAAPAVHPAPARVSRGYLDDPYAGVATTRQPATDDPY